MKLLGLLVCSLILFSLPVLAIAIQVDKLAVECQAGKTKSCQKFADIARTAKDPRVRR